MGAYAKGYSFIRILHFGGNATERRVKAGFNSLASGACAAVRECVEAVQRASKAAMRD